MDIGVPHRKLPDKISNLSQWRSEKTSSLESSYRDTLFLNYQLKNFPQKSDCVMLMLKTGFSARKRPWCIYLSPPPFRVACSSCLNDSGFTNEMGKNKCGVRIMQINFRKNVFGSYLITLNLCDGGKNAVNQNAAICLSQERKIVLYFALLLLFEGLWRRRICGNCR